MNSMQLQTVLVVCLTLCMCKCENCTTVLLCVVVLMCFCVIHCSLLLAVVVQGKAAEAGRDREVRAARDSGCSIVSPHWIHAVSNTHPIASFPALPLALAIIYTFKLTQNENILCECKVKDQIRKTRNASIRKGREPGNEASQLSCDPIVRAQ